MGGKTAVSGAVIRKNDCFCEKREIRYREPLLVSGVSVCLDEGKTLSAYYDSVAAASGKNASVGEKE